MSQIYADDVKIFILSKLEKTLIVNDLKKAEITDNFDLLDGGLIDSLGILELITAIEDHFEIEIDFENLDAEEFTIIGSLCNYIEKY